MTGLDVGLWPDVPHAAYHGDPCIEPSLNASAALTLLNRSPLHAWHQHPRLGGKPSTRSTDAMDTGSLVHALVLGGGLEFVLVEADDWKTKAAREARDEARANGKVAILARKMDECREVAVRVTWAVPEAADDREMTAVWRSGETLCRCRWDAFDGGSGIVYDLKVVEDAARAADGRNVVTSGYDLRAANQVEAVETLLPGLAGRASFRLIFVESTAPYAVVVAELAGDLLTLGRRKWQRAVESWDRCRTADEWPGPFQGRTRITAPTWALDADMDSQIRLTGGSRNSNDELGL